jgi:hypothetical protein
MAFLHFSRHLMPMIENEDHGDVLDFTVQQVRDWLDGKAKSVQDDIEAEIDEAQSHTFNSGNETLVIIRIRR